MRAVIKQATASKAVAHQHRISLGVDQMRGRGHLGAGNLPVQITAGVLCCGIELKRFERCFLGLIHAGAVLNASISCQYRDLKCQSIAGRRDAVWTRLTNSVLEISCAPSDLRCAVFCWQSIWLT